MVGVNDAMSKIQIGKGSDFRFLFTDDRWILMLTVSYPFVGLASCHSHKLGALAGFRISHTFLLDLDQLGTSMNNESYLQRN